MITRAEQRSPLQRRREDKPHFFEPHDGAFISHTGPVEPTGHRESWYNIVPDELCGDFLAATEAGVATVTGPISASPKPNVDRCEGLVAIAHVLRNRFW